MSEKTLLMLRACGHPDEKLECDNIKSQAELYGIEVHDHCPKSNQDLLAILNNGAKYDYIYLSSHGNAEGFASQNRSIDYAWFDFGVQLCSSMCMKKECVVLLSCCRGGLNQVAYDLFFCCEKISFIVGPRQSLTSHDMLISFNILLYNLEYRSIDPIVACEKVKAATDIRFICFDRLETETETGYVMRVQQYERGWIYELNDAKEKADEQPANVNFAPPEILGRDPL